MNAPPLTVSPARFDEIERLLRSVLTPAWEKLWGRVAGGSGGSRARRVARRASLVLPVTAT